MAAQSERERREAARGARGRLLYRRAAWQRLRASQLRKQPWCVDCEAAGRRTPARDVDHVTPHRGDTRVFYDAANLQSLCHPCHSRKTAREVGFGARTVTALAGHV